jgi:hypothetical protein
MTTKANLKMKISLKRRSSRRWQKGEGLIENLMALGISAAVVAAVAIFAPIAYHWFQNWRWSNELQTEKSALQNATSTYSNYASLTTADMITSDVFPKSMVSTDQTTVSGQWGGEITIGPGEIYSAADSIDMTYPQVPQTVCKGALGNMSQSFAEIQVNGTTVVSPSVPFNISTLNQACASNNDNNTVDFIFNKST